MRLYNFYKARGYGQPITFPTTAQQLGPFLGCLIEPLGLSRICHGAVPGSLLRPLSTISGRHAYRSRTYRSSTTFSLNNLSISRDGNTTQDGSESSEKFEGNQRHCQGQQLVPVNIRHKGPYSLVTRSTTRNQVPRLEILAYKRHGKSSPRLPMKAIKRFRRSPAQCLNMYLQETSRESRRSLWQKLNCSGEILGLALPTILMRYLHHVENPEDGLSNLEIKIMDGQASDYLARHNYTVDDLHTWAWVFQASNSDLKAERYLASASISAPPVFVLLQVLGSSQLSPMIISKLLNHCWDRLLRRKKFELPVVGTNHTKRNAPLGPVAVEDTPKLTFEANAFFIAVCRLLSRVRETWPPAMISVARMAIVYFRELKDRSNVSGDPAKTLKVHANLSEMLNRMIERLSLPGKAKPVRSMVHNLRAQQALLAFADECSPPLDINRVSYRAVAVVFAASKKSLEEEFSARLMKRSWPPWRRDQDGMDALRSRDADISRVSRTITRMSQAGYGEKQVDQNIRLIGGRDLDWTPTVQTRTLLKEGRGILSIRKDRARDQQDECAARIKATRDIYEAWAAFRAFKGKLPPSQLMYLAVFEKLDAEQKRLGHGQDIHSALPGDAREVIGVADDNMSPVERQRLQPPSIMELYDQMIEQGLQPSGRCLEFLVSHSQSFRKGAEILTKSSLNQTTVSMLLGFEELQKQQLETIPKAILAAFIKLLCQLTKPIPVDEDNKRDMEVIAIGAEDFLAIPRNIGDPKFSKVQSNPLLHALQILKVANQPYRPAWYALFRSLAQRNVYIDQKLFGTPLSDILSWQVLEAALNDAQNAGMSLDPAGLQIICTGLEKALIASKKLEKHEAALKQSAQKIKAIFALFTQTTTSSSDNQKGSQKENDFLPALLYDLEGAHIHAYVRVLGLLDDINAIWDVLNWMITHQADIAKSALDARNGRVLLRRVLIAMRISLERAESAADDKPEDMIEKDGRLREMFKADIERLEGWGGWPTDLEVQTYRSNGDDSL